MTPSAPPGADPAGAQGESEARLRTWVDAYGPELEAHLTRVLGGADEAADVLQRVWLTAHERPPDDGPDRNVRAWLYRVATRAALDRLARERRRARLLEAGKHDLLAERSDPGPADDGRLSEGARAEVRRRVSALPSKQKQAVWLRWIEGRDYGEVARRLEVSRAAARANVYQGLKRLRTELADLWREGGIS